MHLIWDARKDAESNTFVFQACISHVFFAESMYLSPPTEPGPNIGSSEIVPPAYLIKHLCEQILDTFNE